MAVQSVKQRISGLTSSLDKQELFQLVDSLRTDLETLRVQLNTHVHGGVTVGAGSTAVPTTTIASLNTQP